MDPKNTIENSNYDHKVAKFNITIDFNSSHNNETPPEPFKENRAEIYLDSKSDYY